MVVLIAMLPGISDVAALGAVFGVSATMILFGLLMEHYESPGRPGWLPFFARLRARTTPNVLSFISPHHLSSSLTYSHKSPRVTSVRSLTCTIGVSSFS